MVAADYTMNPSVLAQNTGGLGGALGGLFGAKNKRLGDLVGGLKKKEASTTLILIDNSSSVQIAAATGSAKKFDFSAGLNILSRKATKGSLDGFTDTPEGKIIASAFADSYNKMVRALRNYKTQNVEGGLGKGGKLKIGE